MNNTNVKWVESELKNIRKFNSAELISIHNIDAFSKILITNASSRTNISKDYIIEKNAEFYNYLTELSKSYEVIHYDSEELKKLCSLFKIPIINDNPRNKERMSIGNVREKREEEILNYPQNAEDIMNNSKGGSPMERGGIGFIPGESVYTHVDCMDIFNKLSAVEKIKFIMEFQNVEIKLSPAEILVFKSC